MGGSSDGVSGVVAWRYVKWGRNYIRTAGEGEYIRTADEEEYIIMKCSTKDGSSGRVRGVVASRYVQ